MQIDTETDSFPRSDCSDYPRRAHFRSQRDGNRFAGSKAFEKVNEHVYGELSPRSRLSKSG